MSGDGIDQLQQIAMATQPRGRGRGRGQAQRGRGRTQDVFQGHAQELSNQYSNPNGQTQHDYPPSQAWSAPAQSTSTDMNAFPPLSSTQQQRRRYQQPYQPTQQSQQQYQRQEVYPVHDASQQFQQRPPQHQQGQYVQQNSAYAQHQAQGPARGSFDSSRGRGFRGGYQQQRQNNSYQPQYHTNQPLSNTNDFTRPAGHSNQRLYNTDTNPRYGTSDQQRAFRHKIMIQSDFLASLASQNLKNQMTQEELQAKEVFRRKLQDIAQRAVASLGSDSKPVGFRVEDVKLRLYGSLGSGFAVAGSDMDLLLAFPSYEGSPAEIEIESRRVLEKALLDAGIGARLLTNTRVPILKVCEKPSAELLRNLRAYRLEWEKSETHAQNPPSSDKGNDLLPNLTSVQTEAATEALSKLDLEPTEVPLPASPILDQAKLDFADNCGIQCDINFSNYVALHNTELLKAYGRADARVRQMGIFVKNWAKTRDINTPYRGTLSSYGYILLVLHYLINVVKPPVIPNLQEVQKRHDFLHNIQDFPLVEGFDVRFVRESSEIQDLLHKMPKNHESLGSLLRGFFWYYSIPQGFHWTQDVVSIRTDGGRLTKRSKGWTEAKWANQSSTVRLRYLLAIEDPFEIEHNVGRTVGHSGIVAIREEFRRAWSIIDAVQYDSLAKNYFWLKTDTGERQNAEELMTILTDRGDLLRKDQNFHKDKMRRMRQEAEAKEQALREEAAKEPVSSATADDTQNNGTWTDENSEYPSGVDPLPQSNWMNKELIHDRSYQEKNREWNESKGRTSRRQLQVQDDPEDVNDDNEVQHVNTIGSTSHRDSNDDGGQEGNDCEQDGVKNKGSFASQQEQKDRTSVMKSNKVNVHKERPLPNFARDTTVQTYLDAHNLGSSSTKKIGRRSCWDRQTEAGRWLHWRDNVMRSGSSFEPVQLVYKNLHEKFPYNPEMTFADVAVLNAELQKYYSTSLWPSNMSEVSDPTVESSHNLTTEDVEEQAHEVSISEPEASLPAESFSSPHVLSQSSCASDCPVSTSPITNVSSAVDVEELRKRRTLYFNRGAKQAVSDIGSEIRRDSAVSLVQTQSLPTACDDIKRGQAASETQAQSSHKQEGQALLNHQQKLLSLLNVKAPPVVEQQVPLTLFPNTPNDQRPRDEDPMIMPIPRRVGFQFDPRQLANLDVIRRGGNGCAKQGQEFSVEQDYEFGGGGEMAYKSSSGLRCMSESGVQLSWRPGQADHQEGVLDEVSK